MSLETKACLENIHLNYRNYNWKSRMTSKYNQASKQSIEVKDNQL